MSKLTHPSYGQADERTISFTEGAAKTHKLMWLMMPTSPNNDLQALLQRHQQQSTMEDRLVTVRGATSGYAATGPSGALSIQLPEKKPISTKALREAYFYRTYYTRRG